MPQPNILKIEPVNVLGKQKDTLVVSTRFTVDAVAGTISVPVMLTSDADKQGNNYNPNVGAREVIVINSTDISLANICTKVLEATGYQLQ